MYVYLGLDEYQNNIYHYIKPTIIANILNKYHEKYEEECIKRDDGLNKTWILDQYKFIQFLDN